MAFDNGCAVLVVEDDMHVRNTVVAIMEEHNYVPIACKDAGEALEACKRFAFDVVLTDIRMPGISGLELLEEIHRIYPEIPVILMTAYAEMETAVSAIKKGAFDFLIKPWEPGHVVGAVRKAADYARLKQMERDYKRMLVDTVDRRTRELADALREIKHMNREIIQRLTNAAEFKDASTGTHISRLGLYANKLSEALDMPADFTEMLTLASSMHDIGKIGIPDSILMKPGRLTGGEFEIMKTHTSIGYKILSGSSHRIIQMAASIALNHHERWDGTGYPGGLKGGDIPIEGRIVMLADQYDALRDKRPYKAPFSHKETVAIITEGDGRTAPGHFDPAVLGAFNSVVPLFEDIFNLYQEQQYEQFTTDCVTGE